MPETNVELEKQALLLIEEFADLPEDQQRVAIEKSCANNQALLENCLSLLDIDISDDEVISLVYNGTDASENAIDESGRIIDKYRLEKKIGSGGMADVYYAKRDDGIHDQAVAFKIIRNWGNMGELRGRMKRERKILSQFKHPNIAVFMDGGQSDDKRPYFVLEYVEGKPINDYCHEQALNLKQIIELFIPVCSAVNAAHSKLILHRDLKPTNILVTEDGTPKLLDFGIAKILDDEDSDLTQLTLMGAPMTPNYASPEQVRQEPLSVASDQYSLGVLLYELVTGQLPFEVKTGNPYNTICEGDTLWPSNRVEKQHNLQARDKKTLVKKIRGDLDKIIMKAMHKDYEKRYSSVQELAEDLQRYLKMQPVLAQQDNFLYRTQLFIKRNLVYGVKSLAVLLCIPLIKSIVENFH